MAKRRRGAVDSSDDSDVEPEATVKMESSDDETAQYSPAYNGDSDDSARDTVRARNRRRMRLANLNRNAVKDERNTTENEEDEHSGTDDPKFPVVLRTRNNKRSRGRRRGTAGAAGTTGADGSDESYSENAASDGGSSENNDSNSDDEEFEFSDGGFVVDSDDNVIPAHRANSAKRKPTGRPRGRPRGSGVRRSRRRRRQSVENFGSDTEEDDEFTASEASLAEELKELKGESSPQRKARNYRERAPVNYAIPPPPTIEEVARAAAKEAESAGKPKDPRARRSFDVRGPFGGQDVHTIFEIPPEQSKSVVKRGKSKDVAGAIERIGQAGGLGPNAAQAGVGVNNKGTGDNGGNSADVDPVDVAGDVDFSMVGGLDNYISKLKEMVSLPLLYPELYEKFGITPPRGVLFHGPPGTGKTSMARALAASHRQEKVTFYMRKGADVSSKWIGESERQLRALFEEAQKNQPSIIFFDEIDGLAPVRSAKQEQHHASIVSTSSALMDGMDNRGQVVVIGATNRPDSVDPASRRPGRFDREFYFPSPDFDARKRILEIHTSKWVPPLSEKFVEDIAQQTKGFGGADLRALATEAALLAIQRAYPQIYGSEAKLVVDPNSIQVRAQDFALALEKIQPSTARAAGTSLAQPVPSRIEPLSRSTLSTIARKVSAMFPRENKDSQLAALFSNDEQFKQARAIKKFAQARIHRPRLSLKGAPGNGQEYLSRAVAHLLEGVYVRESSTSTIFGMSGSQPEAAIVNTISEARQRAPACILSPQSNEWLGVPHLDTLLAGLLRSLLPSEQVFVVATSEMHTDTESSESSMSSPLQSFFDMETIDIELNRDPAVLQEYFAPIFEFVMRTPAQCLQADEMPIESPPESPKAPLKTLENGKAKDGTQKSSANNDEVKGTAQLGVFSESERAELRIRSQLKLKLGVILDGFRQRYRRFRKPIIEEGKLVHLFERPMTPVVVDVNPEISNVEKDVEQQVNSVKASNDQSVPENPESNNDGTTQQQPNGDVNATDVPADSNDAANSPSGEANPPAVEEEVQETSVEPAVPPPDEEDEEPYSRTSDNMILERETGKKYYNMDLETVEDRLWNGFYCEPQQFSEDMEMIYRDAVVFGERERMHKASEMSANAQVAIDDISLDKPFIAACQESHAKDAQTRLNESALKTHHSTAEKPQDSQQSNVGDENRMDVDHASDETNNTASISNPAALTKTESVDEIASEVVVSEIPHTTKAVKLTTFVNGSTDANRAVEYDSDHYQNLKKSILDAAGEYSLDELEQLYATLADIAYQHKNDWNRNAMIEKMSARVAKSFGQ